MAVHYRLTKTHMQSQATLKELRVSWSFPSFIAVPGQLSSIYHTFDK